MTSWRLGVLALVLVLLSAGCGGQPDVVEQPAAQVPRFAPDTTMGAIQRDGEIAIGVKFDAPPFGFRDPAGGKVQGFDVDVGRAVAESLGVRPRFVEAVSDDRIPLIQAGEVDLVLSTMTITPQRAQSIGFTDPYFVARGRILVPEGSPITGVDALAGEAVCTTLGSTYELTLAEQAPEADLRLVDKISECVPLLRDGTVDAIVNDDVILTGLIIQDGSLRLVGDDLTTEPYGAGLAAGDEAFATFLDGVLERFKADGRWTDAYQRWLGRFTGETREPPTQSLEDTLAGVG
ncbi:MAG: glutamate ABC transporter substrate-binding protein [Solirubrobacteraceae bacterium MAG38_C4-C5]|nr:glutamate ABC transporter substrate-binding protein [Candidatus Siliceabacter maunaloa]